MKILIVEDDDVAQKLLSSHLSALGSINTSSNGVEAISAVTTALEENQPYDLICMDIVMPEVDGIHALTKIRALEAQKGLSKENRSKVIMTTALSTKGSVVASAKANCNAYIIKPVIKSKLFAELQKFGFTVAD